MTSSDFDYAFGEYEDVKPGMECLSRGPLSTKTPFHTQNSLNNSL